MKSILLSTLIIVFCINNNHLAAQKTAALLKNNFNLGSLPATSKKIALIIGIDTYSPPATYKPSASAGRLVFQDLDGCKNDALSIKSIITSRFSFSANNIQTLFNKEATRDNILRQMNDLLIKSTTGDIAFIYYAGHGSQVYNSLSTKELDKFDETLVPADFWKAGVDDIRDKELAKIFNAFIDKGVKLTVILDCCHSGSMSRGGPNFGTGKLRYMQGKDSKAYDAKDASNPTPPETRKDGSFLIIGAAQDNEFAAEQSDDNNPSQPHGAFTLAFIQALNQQSVNASVQNLFTSVRSILKSNGKTQEPVLSALSERKKETLFGITKGELSDKSFVAVSAIIKNKVELQGGFAIHLYKENELTRVKNGDTIVLKIDTVLDVNRSIASIKKGKIINVKPGELFEVTNWVSSGAPLLKIYIPNSNLSYDQITDLSKINYELKQSKKIHWINNLEQIDPYTKIYFDDGKFYISSDTARGVELKNYDAASILTASKKDTTFYFELPPSKEIVKAIKDKFKENRALAIVNNASEANYILYGTINEEGITSYGLRRTETSAKDSLESMPVRTTPFALKTKSKEGLEFVADSIFYYALRLSKIRGWLQIAGPKGESSEFPYHLQFTNATTNKLIDNAYKIGDRVTLNLVLNDDYQKSKLDQKYVYIFGIDKDGNMALVYPLSGDCSVTNKFPVMQNNETPTKIIDLNTTWTIPAPAGTDNYFLLATKDPINNCEDVFHQEGVVSGTRGAVDNPLVNLLNMGNEIGKNTRGLPPKVKLANNWYLVKVAIKCTR